MKTQQTLSPTDTLEELIKWLLPEQANVRVDQLVFTPGELTLLVTSTQSEGRCPVCEKGRMVSGPHLSPAQIRRIALRLDSS